MRVNKISGKIKRGVEGFEDEQKEQGNKERGSRGI